MAITKRVQRKNMITKVTPETIVIDDEQDLEFTQIDLTFDEFMKVLDKKTQNKILTEVTEKGTSEQNVHLEVKKVYILLNKKMEAIYAQVDKAIYRYGNPETETKDQVKPYEAIFVDGNSVFNLKNIDILDEKEEYGMHDIDDDDDEYSDNNDYNDDTDDDNDDDDNNDDNDDDNDDDKKNEHEPMEIDI
ncbi:coiled-coil domain-containing protein 1-like [Hydra vulgaris]|uniref:coiled-coil domain-containing protein 1-like n=1 Tax=Hydra vulgaris TaxID=6087 RepID=UPI0032E9DB11